jgi:hypothetical protein
MNIYVIASKFKGIGKEGDFNYMIKRDMQLEIDPLTLYIYNDNTESHYSHSYRRGAGNAIIREYNKYNTNLKRPFSAGIPTGSFKNRGFDDLSDEVKNVTNKSIKIIKGIIKDHNIQTIYYSTDDESGKLGQALFKVNDDVIHFITNKIQNLSSNPVTIST